MASPKAATKRKTAKNMQQREFDRLQQAERDLFCIIDHATETLCRLIDNDQGTLKYCTRRAGRAIDIAPNCPQVKDKTWTVEQAERYNLAELIKATIEGITEGPDSRQFGAMLGQCFVSIGISLVNWDDVADHYLQTYRESQAS